MAVTPTPVVTPPTPVTQEPGSLVAELLSPGTWLTALTFIPTFWVVFNLPIKLESPALAAVKVAALLCGPAALIFYMVAHAMKIKAGQARWAYVESSVIDWGKDLIKDPEVAAGWIAEILAAVHNPNPSAVRALPPVVKVPIVASAASVVPVEVVAPVPGPSPTP